MPRILVSSEEENASQYSVHARSAAEFYLKATTIRPNFTRGCWDLITGLFKGNNKRPAPLKNNVLLGQFNVNPVVCVTFKHKLDINRYGFPGFVQKAPEDLSVSKTSVIKLWENKLAPNYVDLDLHLEHFRITFHREILPMMVVKDNTLRLTAPKHSHLGDLYDDRAIYMSFTTSEEYEDFVTAIKALHKKHKNFEPIPWSTLVDYPLAMKQEESRNELEDSGEMEDIPAPTSSAAAAASINVETNDSPIGGNGRVIESHHTDLAYKKETSKKKKKKGTKTTREVKDGRVEKKEKKSSKSKTTTRVIALETTDTVNNIPAHRAQGNTTLLNMRGGAVAPALPRGEQQMRPSSA